jgi:hypothetical protein
MSYGFSCERVRRIAYVGASLAGLPINVSSGYWQLKLDQRLSIVLGVNLSLPVMLGDLVKKGLSVFFINASIDAIEMECY